MPSCPKALAVLELTRSSSSSYSGHALIIDLSKFLQGHHPVALLPQIYCALSNSADILRPMSRVLFLALHVFQKCPATYLPPVHPKTKRPNFESRQTLP